MVEPNKERIQKWVDALRSGEFKQGYGQLRDETFNNEYRHCCLGVACEVFRRETGRGAWTDSNDFVVHHEDENLEVASSHLPPSVIRWFGLPCKDPLIAGSSSSRYATIRNDADRWTFEQIADGTERTYIKEKTEK
jgi:hypothetical protein